jgi:hypothetical protein
MRINLISISIFFAIVSCAVPKLNNHMTDTPEDELTERPSLTRSGPSFYLGRKRDVPIDIPEQELTERPSLTRSGHSFYLGRKRDVPIDTPQDELTERI